MVTILVIEPEQAPVTREVVAELRALQAVVGGYLEAVPLAPGIALWCNEERNLHGLRPNRLLPEIGDIIYGTFIIARTGSDGNWVSLTDKDVTHYSRKFRNRGSSH